jgi:hypothetical protein
MDETRIPKLVERIILLTPDSPQVLYKRVKKDKDKKLTAFRKSVKDAVLAMADVPRRGSDLVLDRIPDAKGGDMFAMFGNNMRKFRKRGMRMLRGKM